MKLHSIAALACASSLVACATTDLPPPPAFGQAVNEMIRAQVANPQSDVTPQPAPMDGAKAAAAMEAYRSGKAARETTRAPVTISVD